MLQVNSMNYNASAASVGANEEQLATFYFNADNYNNFSFNINFSNKTVVENADVWNDFAAFKAQVADMLEENF